MTGFDLIGGVVISFAFLPGSFATASCLGCKFKVPGEAIREAIMSQRTPYCPKCCPEVGLEGLPAVLSSSSGTEPVDESKPTPPVTAVMKPDIVFFGESLPPEFHATLGKDMKDVDLVLVMGSSLKVHPVSYIPSGFSTCYYLSYQFFVFTLCKLSHLTFIHLKYKA